MDFKATEKTVVLNHTEHISVTTTASVLDAAKKAWATNREMINLFECMCNSNDFDVLFLAVTFSNESSIAFALLNEEYDRQITDRGLEEEDCLAALFDCFRLYQKGEL